MASFTIQVINWAFKAGFQFLKWVVKNPDMLLRGWFVSWLVMAWGMFSSQGLMPTVQFLMTGMLNLGSVLGLPIPIFAMLMVLIKSLASLLKKYIVDGIVSMINFIKRQLNKVGDKIKKSNQKVKRAFARLKQTESDSYLGMDVDLAERQEEFLASVEELLYALELDGQWT